VAGRKVHVKGDDMREKDGPTGGDGPCSAAGADAVQAYE